MGFLYYSVYFIYLPEQLKWTYDTPICHTLTTSQSMSSHTIFLSVFLRRVIPSCISYALFPEDGYKGDPISLHLLIPKSKLVSMRNREECVSLTFFVECICTSCSSNLKQPTASLIESSPWRLLSGAQVSSKKEHVHMNATNDHMFEGVDPQPVSCDPLAGKKRYKSFWQDYGIETTQTCAAISVL